MGRPHAKVVDNSMMSCPCNPPPHPQNMAKFECITGQDIKEESKGRLSTKTPQKEGEGAGVLHVEGGGAI